VEAGARAQDGQILQEVFRRCDDFFYGVPQAGSSLGTPGGGSSGGRAEAGGLEN